MDLSGVRELAELMRQHRRYLGVSVMQDHADSSIPRLLQSTLPDTKSKWFLSRAFDGITLHISFLQHYTSSGGSTFTPLLYPNAIQVCILQAAVSKRLIP